MGFAVDGERNRHTEHLPTLRGRCLRLSFSFSVPGRCDRWVDLWRKNSTVSRPDEAPVVWRSISARPLELERSRTPRRAVTDVWSRAIGASSDTQQGPVLAGSGNPATRSMRMTGNTTTAEGSGSHARDAEATTPFSRNALDDNHHPASHRPGPDFLVFKRKPAICHHRACAVRRPAYVIPQTFNARPRTRPSPDRCGSSRSVGQAGALRLLGHALLEHPLGSRFDLLAGRGALIGRRLELAGSGFRSVESLLQLADPGVEAGDLVR